MIAVCRGSVRSTNALVRVTCKVLLILLFGLSAPLRAENPWGPECKSLDECLQLFKKLPECEAADQQCFWSTELTDQGLSQQVSGFGQSAVAPMIDLIKSGTATQAARAANVLNEFQDTLSENDKVEILAAWRRGSPGLNLIASSSANPAFVRELMQLVRKNPTPGGREEHTFTNLRDWEEVSNGIIPTVSEHIECSEGETCDPVFAKIQFNWLVSNYREDEDFASISKRFIQAIRNPILDEEGKLAALELFEPRQYGREINRMRAISVPFLKTVLAHGSSSLRNNAARFLVGFGDYSGKDDFWTIAKDVGAKTPDRISALQLLQRMSEIDTSTIASMKTLNSDPDWDVRRESVILLARNKSHENVSLILKMISPNDWRTTFSAVSALRESGDQEAIKTLQETAKSYWHPFVRAAAESRPKNNTNLSQFPEKEKAAVEFADKAVANMKFPVSEVEDFELSRICKARFESDGYRFVPDNITGPDVVQEMEDASTHNRKHEIESLLGLKTFTGAKKMEAKLRYGDAIFEGVKNETDAGKLVVKESGREDRTIVQGLVSAVFIWNGRPHAVAGGQPRYPASDAYLFELVQNNGRDWHAVKKLRLTGSPEVWLASDNTICILGTEAILQVHGNGEPEWVGCPSPSFP